MSCSEYLKLVERRISEEEARCLNYLIESTKGPLVHTIIEVMVEKYADILINMTGSGLKQMIEHEQYSNIKRMYDLFLNSKTAINHFETFLVCQVKERGFQIVTDKELLQPQKEKDMIDTLINMRRQYSDIMEKSCNKDNKISLSIKWAFEDFINRQYTISVIMAKYIDQFFWVEVKGMNDQTITF